MNHACDAINQQWQTTEVFDTYWRFAAERQEIYYARLLQEPRPYTADSVLQTFKFTNAYRAADRVSQYLIRHVIYGEDVGLTPEDLVFRILLFKVFNKIETWELLEQKLGPITFRRFQFDDYDRVLSRALAARRPVYSAAYIMPDVGKMGQTRKHRNHLVLIERMLRGGFAKKLASCKTMGEAYHALLEYPSIGRFLAYQLVTDINYSELTDFSEQEFVSPGPGAVDGLRKVFGKCNVADEDLIRLCCERQEEEFASRNLAFRTLFGRPLQYIDCQNLFCEVDKYSRVAHPERVGQSGRTKIKQRFKENAPLPTPWFPPKWDINRHIPDVCVT